MIWEKMNAIATMFALIMVMLCKQVYGQDSVMTHLSYRSDINYRYAVTWITANMENPSDNATEIFFKMTLPKTAFISGLIMEVNGVNYTSLVEEKKTAQNIYNEAKKQGNHAGLVKHSGTTEQKFEVSTNVEAKGKVIFYLKYEELLLRSKGKYTQNIQIKPGVNPQELDVAVNIKESEEIMGLKVVQSPLGGHNGTHVHQVDPNHAVVSYHSKASEGVYGELTITYDVRRKKDAGEILVEDGYFVHFFSPDGLEKMPAHTVFILDVSGSMDGVRLDKLKESMLMLLNDLKSEDSFELLTFSNDVESLGVYRKSNTSDMKLAREKISNLHADGGTNINDALLHGIKNAMKSCQISANQVVFLTDGEATTGETNPSSIIKNIQEINTKNIPLYSLAFGNDADFRSLNKISFHNRGFARKIPVDSNTEEILRGFYQEIGTPLMADIDIKYADDAVNQTTIVKKGWSTLQKGNEIIVAGQMNPGINELNPKIDGILNTGTHQFKVPRVSKPIHLSGKETFIDRLCAYLTIQNLTDTADLTEDSIENEALNARALSLALKYNFVTKLTSLVVVRPEDLQGEQLLPVEEEAQEEYHKRPAFAAHPAYAAPSFQYASSQNSGLKQSFQSIRGASFSSSSSFGSNLMSASLRPSYGSPPRAPAPSYGPPLRASAPSYGPPPRAPTYQYLTTRRPITTTTTQLSSLRPGSPPSYPPPSPRPIYHSYPAPPSYQPPTPPSVCDPVCLNGQCVSTNNCSCSSGWTGQYCDIRICDPECVMGERVSPNKCSCSSGWIGQHCDKRCPNDFFTSSGTCYKLFTDQKLNWQDAMLKCSSEGLMAASKPSDPVGLRKYIIDNYDVGTLVWLNARGAHSHYIWEQDNSTLSFNDPLWANDEPKNYSQGDDSCLYLRTRYINWNLEPEKPYGASRCEDSNLAYALCEM